MLREKGNRFELNPAVIAAIKEFADGNECVEENALSLVSGVAYLTANLFIDAPSKVKA